MSNTLIISLIVGTALVAGLIANRFVRPFAKTEVQGVKLETLTGPIVSITVLLLAFSLVTVYQSYLRGWTAAADEARKVDYQFEMSALLTEPERQNAMAATACYAAAVANYEWTTMEEGRTAPEVSPWTAQLSAVIAAVVKRDEAPSPVLSTLLAADRDRGEARSRRLTEAQAAVPPALKGLLVLTAALGILILATFTLGSVNRRVQIGVLTALSVIFIMFLSAIWDMDSPYKGIITVSPVDMTRVSANLGEDFTTAYPGVALPCDPSGKRTD
jgi:hypothetical protein